MRGWYRCFVALWVANGVQLDLGAMHYARVLLPMKGPYKLWAAKLACLIVLLLGCLIAARHINQPKIWPKGSIQIDSSREL